MTSNKVTAIVFFNDGKKPRKYRNCRIQSFMNFISKVAGAEYVNFYLKAKAKEEKGQFLERIYIQ